MGGVLPATLQVGVGAEGVVIVVAWGDGRHLVQEITVGQFVVRTVEQLPRYLHLPERLVGKLQHVEYPLAHPLVVRAVDVEEGQPQAVGFVLHLARAVVVAQEMLHLLLGRTGTLPVARHLLPRVFAVVVYYFVTYDECQLRLVFHLCHQPQIHKYHPLPGGEGIDRRAFHRVEPQLPAQFGIVFQQCVGYALYGFGDGVAIQYAAVGGEPVDVV